MSLSKRLTDYLDGRHVSYVSLRHNTAFTAQEIAASLHISGKLMTKTVIVTADGRLLMVILPAKDKINFDLLKEALHAQEIGLANEWEFTDCFPDCERGAMPPFGNLYNLPVYVAETLAGDQEILFNAGAHDEAIKMRYTDFEKLVHPPRVTITYHH